MALLKRRYDGYHFTRNCPDIYNPFSLFCAFEKDETGNYWFATGTPTFLINALRDSDTYLPDLLNSEADIPYDLSKNKPEVYFENNIYIIFKLMGFTVETEYRTSAGRIDLLVKTKDYIYVIELKLNGTPEEALAQINEKGYALPFASDPRTLFKIGISFSKETRNINSWIIAEQS